MLDCRGPWLLRYFSYLIFMCTQALEIDLGVTVTPTSSWNAASLSMNPVGLNMGDRGVGG